MAKYAVAREAVFALRRQIAAIEGRAASAARKGMPAEDAPVPMRQRGGVLPAAPARLATGAADFDSTLEGGIERGALCEIHVDAARDAGAGAGFVLALAGLLHEGGPLLWVGTGESFGEAGFPHAGGLWRDFGLSPEMILLAETRKPLDALWTAGEAAGLEVLSAVILELRGDPACLDLTATRRLHRRARAGGRPVFLLRLSASRQPAAAPLRLAVSPAPSAPASVLGRPLAGTLGPPGFTVAIEKCRTGQGGRFILEWDCNERLFRQRPPLRRRPTDPVALVSASADRPDPAPPPRQIVAIGSGARRKTG